MLKTKGPRPSCSVFTYFDLVKPVAISLYLKLSSLVAMDMELGFCHADNADNKFGEAQPAACLKGGATVLLTFDKTLTYAHGPLCSGQIHTNKVTGTVIQGPVLHAPCGPGTR